MCNNQYLKILAVIAVVAVGVQAVWADVSGRVATEHGEGIPECAVTLLAPSDSTFVDAAVTDENGNFIFSIANNEFLIKTQCYGFKSAIVNYTGKPITITLSPETSDLAEVTVTGQKPGTLKRESNKFIYIPDALPGEVHKAYDVLKIVPLISLENDVVSMIGKGSCKIYINGRPPKWGSMTLSLLKTMKPDKIKRIEIITNPDLSLGASDSSGILNLIMDEPDWGFNGVAQMFMTNSFDKNTYTKPTFMANYVHDKIAVSANVNYTNHYTDSHSLSNYFYKKTGHSVTNNQYSNSLLNDFDARLMFSYKPTEKSDMGVVVSTQGQGSVTRERVQSFDSREEEPELFFRKSKTPFSIPMLFVGAYYYLDTDDKGSTLDIMASYAGFHSQSSTVYNTTEGSLSEEYPAEATTARGSAKFKHIFNDGSDLSAGINYSFTEYDLKQQIAGNSIQFIYRDYLSGAFLNYNRRWNRWFSSMTGIRVEYDRITGKMTGGEADFSRNDLNIVPRMSLSFNLPKANQSISLDFATYLSRPEPYQVNPYKFWTSPNTYSCGNPELKIRQDYNLSLMYVWDKVVVNTQYFYSPSNVRKYTFDDGNGNTVTSFKNFGRSNDIYITIDYTNTFFRHFRLSSDLGAFYHNNHILLNNNNLSYSEWSGRWDCSLKYVLSKLNMSFSISNRLTTPEKAIGRDANGWTDKTNVSIEKYFPFGLSANLTFMNIFNVKKDSFYYSADYDYYSHSYDNGYGFQLNLYYTFGNSQLRENKATRYAP